MIHITLWPDLVDWPVDMQVSGMIITIDGQPIDFSVIPDGYRLPCEAVDNKWFVWGKFVERKGEDIYMTLRHPVSMRTLESIRAPSEPIVITLSEGRVDMPSGLMPSEPQVDVVLPTEVSND